MGPIFWEFRRVWDDPPPHTRRRSPPPRVFRVFGFSGFWWVFWVLGGLWATLSAKIVFFHVFDGPGPFRDLAQGLQSCPKPSQDPKTSPTPRKPQNPKHPRRGTLPRRGGGHLKPLVAPSQKKTRQKSRFRRRPRKGGVETGGRGGHP